MILIKQFVGNCPRIFAPWTIAPRIIAPRQLPPGQMPSKKIALQENRTLTIKFPQKTVGLSQANSHQRVLREN